MEYALSIARKRNSMVKEKYNYTITSLVTCRSFTFSKKPPSLEFIRKRLIWGYTIVITIRKK